ncbi:MAG TPA: tetratricopeptide repeat protein [Candidatus Limnocylindrales bacterium]|nr:tetratricopeptide repeat protein [Candidatus Limnocylindrales bacterium]
MIEILLQAEGALSVGLLDRAEELYRQVATADPRNSIAVVGLARVALERGDEVGALTMARRALVVDSENTAAQRMVQRLEEVLRHRGVAVESVPAAVQSSAPSPGPGPEAPRVGAQQIAERRSLRDRVFGRSKRS